MKKLLIILAVSAGFSSFALDKFDIKINAEAGYNYDKSYKFGGETLVYIKDNYFSSDVYFKAGIGATGGVNLNNRDGVKAKGYLGPVLSLEVGKDFLRDLKVYGNLEGGLPLEMEIKEKKLVIGVKPTITLSAGVKFSIVNAEVGIGYPGVVGRIGFRF